MQRSLKKLNLREGTNPVCVWCVCVCVCVYTYDNSNVTEYYQKIHSKVLFFHQKYNN